MIKGWCMSRLFRMASVVHELFPLKIKNQQLHPSGATTKPFDGNS